MIGKTILHYRILEQIGQRGMGVVYKAEDTKLRRTVALKFLSQSLIGGEEENQRFKREAKAAAALNHPNIAHVYAVDEVDGQAFIAGILLARCMRENYVQKAYTRLLTPPSSLSSQVMLKLHALASQFSGYIQTLFFIP